MKVFLSLVLCGLVALAVAEKVKYNNYKVYRFTPRTEEERKVLLDLEENNPGFVFWKHVRGVGLPVDIMVPPHLVPMISDIRAKNVPVQEMVNDVQSLIDVEALGSLNASPRLSWDAYYPLAEIYSFVDEICAQHSAVCTGGSYGQSYEGRDLKYVKLNKGNTDKPIIFIDANIHAREWITNTIATWCLKELLEGEANEWLNTFNFYIVPVMNPDGYEYSRQTDRMWRKTRSNLAGGLCRGADPNRNFAFGWNTGGSSNQPCSDTFMGVSAFSEPETLAASELLDSIADNTVFYLSLHSYSQLILIPYGTALGRIPDHQEHMNIGNAAANAISQRYGTQFTPGNIVELLYVASGASVDYMKGEHDTDLTYTFEMRDTGRYGFILPPDQIVPSCLEFMDGFHVMLERLAAKHGKVYF
jgi:carboxypeptidase A